MTWAGMSENVSSEANFASVCAAVVGIFKEDALEERGGDVTTAVDSNKLPRRKQRGIRKALAVDLRRACCIHFLAS